MDYYGLIEGGYRRADGWMDRRTDEMTNKVCKFKHFETLFFILVTQPGK